MTMRQVGDAVALAITLAEAKETLRIDADDTSLDALISIWIRGVTAEAEHSAQCVFVNRPMRVTLDAFSDAIRLASPVFSVEAIGYVDVDGAQQALDPQDYFADMVTLPGYLVPAAGKAWPATAAINAVTVNFTAGFGPDETTVPDCARLYILARLAEQWEPSTKKFESTAQSVYLTRLLDPIVVYG